MPVKIERANELDVDAIVSIYNWAILNTSASFEIEERTVEQQLAWFQAHDEKHPVIVARRQEEGENVVGWGSITRWSTKPAYDGMAEISVYVHPDYHGCGVGREIILALIELGRKGGFRTLVSQISETAEASLHLHRKLGFVDTGILKRAGVKFGQEVDVLVLQIFFDN